MDTKQLIKESAVWAKRLYSRISKMSKKDLRSLFSTPENANLILNEFIQRRDMFEFFSDRGYLDEAFNNNMITKDEYDLAFCLVNTNLELSSQKENHKNLLAFVIQQSSWISAKCIAAGLSNIGLGLKVEAK